MTVLGSVGVDEELTDHIDAASTSDPGLMSAADKTKLDGIASGATVYSDEAARDAIGTALVAGDGIDITVDDPGNTITVAAEAASTSNAGITAYATASDVTDGTSQTLAVTPYALAQSAIFTKTAQFFLSDPAGSPLVTGDGDVQGYLFWVPGSYDGYVLSSVLARLTTASSQTDVVIQLRRYRSNTSNDMLSTRLTIDATETSSLTSAAPAVINTSYDDVAFGDVIYFDIDGAGINAKGLYVEMTFVPG